MRRTLKALGLIGVTTAAGVAAVKRLLQADDPPAHIARVSSNVSQELRQALNRFEDRFEA